MKGYHSDIPGYSPILVILSNYRVNSAIIKVNKDQYLVSDLLYYVRKVRLPMIARLIQYVVKTIDYSRSKHSIPLCS